LIVCVECDKFPDNLHISNVNTTENGGWIEITNYTDTAISTKGLYLSVNEPCEGKDCENCTAEIFCNWQMPQFILRPSQTVKIRAKDNNICVVFKRMQTNFNLSVGHTLHLTDPRGNTLSTLDIE
jgi:hypothetical protein